MASGRNPLNIASCATSSLATPSAVDSSSVT